MALFRLCSLLMPLVASTLIAGCTKSGNDLPAEKPDTTGNYLSHYNPRISDEYGNIAAKQYSSMWGPYNLHDPSIIKEGDTYYIYSTDVAYGPNGSCGIMQRKSNDLVVWSFMGWVFNGVPAKPLEFMNTYQPGYQQLSIWAPYIIKVGNQFRLYYSVPGNNGLKLACIALATSESPEGPWEDKGIVISCQPAEPFNAIDPAVIIDQANGKHWMAYGSYEEGLFMVELSPTTGMRLNETDTGHKIAYRNRRHDAIEGPEILYVPEQNLYYLFVSYDWLEDAYNVRVGRSDKPEGPYFDINGKNMAEAGNNLPMITAQYRFNDHSGWQGVGHNSLLHDGDDYFFVSQGRLGSNKFFMNLHVRRMVFTPDGWPVVSPERYAALPQTKVTRDDLTGIWEHIELLNTATKNVATTISLNTDGTITGGTITSWTFTDNVLTLGNATGQKVFSARVFPEWDWERSRATIVYTGLTPGGLACWGKRTKKI
jgi:arabinan endo-1,5-alpha-L-arabinosidase